MEGLQPCNLAILQSNSCRVSGKSGMQILNRKDACFFGFVDFIERGEQITIELFSKNPVDLRFDHTAFLIGFHRGIVCEQTLADDVRLDPFCGVFDEFRLGVDGLPDNVIAFDIKFCF